MKSKLMRSLVTISGTDDVGDIQFICDEKVGGTEFHDELPVHGVHLRKTEDRALIWMDMVKDGEVVLQTKYELARAESDKSNADSFTPLPSSDVIFCGNSTGETNQVRPGFTTTCNLQRLTITDNNTDSRVASSSQEERIMIHGLNLQFDGIEEEDFFGSTDRRLTILSGANNGGKSLVLKEVFLRCKGSAFLCGNDRYFQVDPFASCLGQPEDKQGRYAEISKLAQSDDQNNDPVLHPFSQVFPGLSDTQRKTVYEVCSTCLGEELSLQFTQPDNSMSTPYLKVGDTQFARCSSGSRMLVHLVSVLVSSEYPTVLIDEPELGLSPRIQNLIQRMLFDTTGNKFDHLKHVFIATHSHIFLNRYNLSDNFLVEKSHDALTIKRLSQFQDFRDLQFSQLGNSFSNLQIPTGFIVVEGPTDYRYLKQLLDQRFPDHGITIINANGDGQLNKVLCDLISVVGSLDTSPYAARVLVILDKVEPTALESEFREKGLRQRHIFKFPENSIEFYYPKTILAAIFDHQSPTNDDLEISGDRITCNGITMTKTKLCDKVLSMLTVAEVLDTSLRKLLSNLEAFR